MGNRTDIRIYGPVPSRRLGLSLGVDVVPYKVCCYDCVYCQLGPTTEKTAARQHFVDPDLVAREVEQALRQGPPPEVLTLAGSGEPTLFADLATLVRELRRITALPLALLTNGGLLWDDRVAAVALEFDLVAPSLDAADAETFARVNRPVSSLGFDQVLAGLRRFCQRFAGRCRLEVMLVRGLNDGPESLAALARIAGSLERLERVDLNTVVRPPADPAACGLDPPGLTRSIAAFEGCNAEIIAPYAASGRGSSPQGPANTRALVAATLARRPCTLEDLRLALGIDAAQIRAACAALLDEGQLQQEQREGGVYYRVRRRAPGSRSAG